MRWNYLIAGATAAIVGSTSGHATTYMTPAQARVAMFPSAASFIDRNVVLTPQQRSVVQKIAGIPVRAPKIMAWEAVDAAGKRLGWVIVDRVLGKHEFVTFALALDAGGAIKGIEVLDYRETYGDQIRNLKWRAQFTGKRHGATLQLDKDIKNISGATLSCRHVTDGVKRLLATYDAVLSDHG
ncbi:FMN-binding protein [Aquisediminimonas sediminicola]|uniref:FMN-binding protein n=1 Tax=Alteraquisediminimonas sediminicola TaxID=2676787 RepID=UPI001C8DEACF|nr:FMN-binding protein [Aquisediminimonas sediminicola]